MTEFNYTIDPVDVARLRNEIEESAITIAIESVSALGTAVTIVFKADLSSGEETLLDTIAEEHTGEPMPDSFVQNVSIAEKDELDRLKVAIDKKSGASRTYVSHDFVRKTTWYMGSTRVTGETLTSELGLGLVYPSANTNWIDLVSGHVTDEYVLQSTYAAKVYVNGTLQTSGYTINYALGKVTFSSSKAGQTVTVDYSYAGNSHYIISPPTGGKFQINRAEVQFTKNITMKQTCVEVWAYDPENLPNRIAVPGTKRCFKSEKDVINISNSGKNKIEQFGSLPTDVWEFPFDYESAILLDDALGMQLRVYTENDEPYGIASGSDAFMTVAFHGDTI